MDTVALPPPDLAALGASPARPAAVRQGPLDAAGPAPPGAEAFAQFLALFVPGGEALPPGGKPLPAGLPDSAEAALADLDRAPPSLPETPPSDLAALNGLAVWLAMRGDTDTSAGAVALDTAEGFAAPSPAALARPVLGTVSVPVAPASVQSAMGRSAAGGSTAGSPALPPDEAAAFELPIASADVPQGEAHEAATFDALVRGEALTDAARARADARTATPAPTPSAQAGLPTAAAPWLAPLDPAAAQPATRIVDAAGGTARTPRKVDALAFASSVAGSTETTLPATEGLAPAMPATGTTPSATAATAAAASTFGDAPVDTRAQQWQEAFAGRVQWLVDQGVGEARIRLNPPELGAVDVKISLVEDKTFVQLTAATAAARDELAQSLPRLRDLFVASGLELGGASVQGGRGGHAGAGTHAGGGYESTPRHASDGPARDIDGFAPAEAPRLARHRAGAIDVFA